MAKISSPSDGIGLVGTLTKASFPPGVYQGFLAFSVGEARKKRVSHQHPLLKEAVLGIARNGMPRTAV